MAEQPASSKISDVTAGSEAGLALGQAAPEPLVIGQPAPGATQTVSLEPDQPVLLDVPADATLVSVDGANFVLSFDGDGDGAPDSRVVFLNLVDQAASDSPPQFVIGGQLVSSGELITQTIALGGGNGEPIPFTTAAPEPPAGGGANVYNDDLGGTLDLLLKQGVLDPTSLVFRLPDPLPGERIEDPSADPQTTTTTVTPESPSLAANPDFEDIRPNREDDPNAPETSVTIDVLANDADSEGDPLSILPPVTLDDPAQGTVEIIDNKLVFTPAPGVSDTTVGMTYSVQDPDGNTTSSTVQVTIGQDLSVQRIVAEADRDELLSSVDVGTVDVDGPNGGETTPFDVNVELYPNKDVSFTVTANPDTHDVLDLYVLQDLTGSFRDDLMKVRGDQSDSGDAADLGLLDDLVNGVEAISSDVHFGLGSFRDSGPNGGSAPGSQYDFAHHLDLAPGEGGNRLDGDPLADPPANLNTPAGKDAAYDEFYAGELDVETTGLGGDFPEKQLFALNEIAKDAILAEDGNDGTASDFGFRNGSSKVVVIITDATSHNWNDPAFKAELKANLLASGVVPIFLVAAGDQGADVINAFYDEVIAELGVGARVPLEADSSNLVEAIQQGLNGITQNLTLNVEGDENGYVSISDPVVDPETGEHSWEVTLSAPLDKGHNNDEITLKVTNDSNDQQVGGEINVNVTTDAPEAGGENYDIVEGHNGQNILNGGEGDDLIIGLGGDDILIGGEGNDVFAFGAREDGGDLDFDGNDIIDDFVKGEDRINLDALFDAMGIDNAADREAAVNVNTSGSDTEITVTGADDFMITLSGVTDALTIGSAPDSDIVI